jgi:hypothetical protein
VLGVHQVGNDPRSEASLKSSMTFGRLTFDAQLRYVGELPSPVTPDYTDVRASVLAGHRQARIVPERLQST